MLTDLTIRNFAIIDKLHVRLDRGFTVLTGETGAGKSIIIDAVNLILGGRARTDLIRTGEEEAVVEALFELPPQAPVRERLDEAGIEVDGEVVIRRVVSRSGKNRVFINGALSTLSQLQSFASQLVSIYGQHEHQTLQDPESHLSILDRCGALEGRLQAYRQVYGEYEQQHRLLEGLTQAERDRQQRLDLLAFQSREIAAMDLTAGEDEELEAQRLLLQNAERLAAATGGGYDTLYGQEEAVCGRLDGVAADLEAMAGVDGRLTIIGEAVRSALYSLEDVAMQLRDYGSGLSFEPGRLDSVEQRLAQISDLKRKYAPTVAGIFDYKAKIELELQDLSDVEATREGLQQQLDALRIRLDDAGETLTTARRQAAEQLQTAMRRELEGLAMAKVHFEVRFCPLAAPGPDGLERAEFFFSANPGEEPRPLARIASGGELSRLMLAIRRSAPGSDAVSTLVFDEVDAGIGGVAATAVGEKLLGVAGDCQVLCITHLPQVAAFAEHHFHVRKRQQGGRTYTGLEILEGEERVAEMARMLGGANVTAATLEHAREFLSHATVGADRS